MSRVRLLALVLLALLFVAAPAGAAVKPRFLGTGHDPGIAVDTAGTAHVGWFTQDDTLEYCQVPRRARRCTLRRSFQLADFGVGKVHVLVPRPGVVIIPVSDRRSTAASGSTAAVPRRRSWSSATRSRAWTPT